jgi:hypothetical protein
VGRGANNNTAKGALAVCSGWLMKNSSANPFAEEFYTSQQLQRARA